VGFRCQSNPNFPPPSERRARTLSSLSLELPSHQQRCPFYFSRTMQEVIVNEVCPMTTKFFPSTSPFSLCSKSPRGQNLLQTLLGGSSHYQVVKKPMHPSPEKILSSSRFYDQSELLSALRPPPVFPLPRPPLFFFWEHGFPLDMRYFESNFTVAPHLLRLIFGVLPPPFSYFFLFPIMINLCNPPAFLRAYNDIE